MMAVIKRLTAPGLMHGQLQLLPVPACVCGGLSGQPDLLQDAFPHPKRGASSPSIDAILFRWGAHICFASGSKSLLLLGNTGVLGHKSSILAWYDQCEGGATGWSSLSIFPASFAEVPWILALVVNWFGCFGDGGGDGASF